MVNKFIIGGTDISIIILHLDDHCANLNNWVREKPNNFSIERWYEGDKIAEIHYSGVKWQGEVVHSCDEEMTSCIGSVFLTYENMLPKS